MDATAEMTLMYVRWLWGAAGIQIVLLALILWRVW
jgi:hypothetical protein